LLGTLPAVARVLHGSFASTESLSYHHFGLLLLFDRFLIQGGHSLEVTLWKLNPRFLLPIAVAREIFPALAVLDLERSALKYLQLPSFVLHSPI